MQWCPFPDNVEEGSYEFILDGCVVVGGTMPGGTFTNYDLGATLTHEVGHHMGEFLISSTCSL
jgi:hypothetical protein